MEGKKDIDSFVTAVNDILNNDKVFKQILDKAVKNALSGENQYFKTLDEFANFLPNVIKDFFEWTGNLNYLGESWKEFKIEEEDLEKLYEINLEINTKSEIINRFNILNMEQMNNEKMLSGKENVQRALDTFQKILNKDQVAANIFRCFVVTNFANDVLSTNDIQNLMKCVNLEQEGTNAFDGWRFWNFCSRLAETPSKVCIDFMVKNTNFNSTEEDLDKLISKVIVLMQKHGKYLESPTKENILAALKDILGGKSPYEEFSKALLAVPNIAGKIELETIITNSQDREVQEFAYTLISNGIGIKLDQVNENRQFVVEENVYSSCSADVLIECLSKEPGLNQWIQDVFTVNKDNVQDELAKDCSLIGKINSVEELMLAKVTAIEKFITQSQDKDRLSKVYESLLKDENKESLLNVKLNNDTVKWALDSLNDWFPKNVLVNGKNYERFRGGLKTFFKEAKDSRDRTAKDINVGAILTELMEDKVPLVGMLRDCGMDLKYNQNAQKLTVKEVTIPLTSIEEVDGDESVDEDEITEQIEKTEKTNEVKIEEKPKEVDDINNDINNNNERRNSLVIMSTREESFPKKHGLGDSINSEYPNPKIQSSPEKERNKKRRTKKSKFPTWAKVLIGLVILAVAVLALLFGFGALGTVFGIAAVGTAKTVALVVGIFALFAELIYLTVVLPNMNRTHGGPGGGGSGGGPNLIEFNDIRLRKNMRKDQTGLAKNKDETRY